MMAATFLSEKHIEKACFWILLAILVCLAFSIRFGISLSTILLVLLVVVHPKRKGLIITAFKDPIFICAFLLFLLQLSGIFYADDSKQAWKEFTKKAGLFAIPFFFCSWKIISQVVLKKLVRGFSLSLFIVSMYCLILAGTRYANDGNTGHFFYHELVKPVGHHAIFYSFFLFYCVLYGLEAGIRQNESRERWLPIVTVILFTVMILLLSSKIAIGILLIYITIVLGRTYFSKQNKWLLPVSLILITLFSGIILLTANPIKKRFADIIGGNSNLFRQERFSPDIYFNGLQFRLLAWRFTCEILEEKNAWITGVSPGDAQNELDRKFVESNIYLGEDGKSGFLGFNCHNVYFQTLLESGIIGVLILAGFIFFFIRSALHGKNYIALYFFIAMTVFGLTESLLSTQYAILLYFFLPLLALKSRQQVR